jgi:hypothetical protein
MHSNLPSVMWKAIPMKPRAGSAAPFAGMPTANASASFPAFSVSLMEAAPVVQIRSFGAVRFELSETLRAEERGN